MFTSEEIGIIERECFNINILGSSVAELQSQNKDWWMIMETEQYLSKKELSKGKPKECFYFLMHKHSDANGYHEHGTFSCVLDAVLEILNHDDYRLKHRGKTEFDRLLDEVRKVR